MQQHEAQQFIPQLNFLLQRKQQQDSPPRSPSAFLLHQGHYDVSTSVYKMTLATLPNHALFIIWEYLYFVDFLQASLCTSRKMRLQLAQQHAFCSMYHKKKQLFLQGERYMGIPGLCALFSFKNNVHNRVQATAQVEFEMRPTCYSFCKFLHRQCMYINGEYDPDDDAERSLYILPLDYDCFTVCLDVFVLPSKHADAMVEQEQLQSYAKDYQWILVGGRMYRWYAKCKFYIIRLALGITGHGNLFLSLNNQSKMIKLDKIAFDQWHGIAMSVHVSHRYKKQIRIFVDGYVFAVVDLEEHFAWNVATQDNGILYRQGLLIASRINHQ